MSRLALALSIAITACALAAPQANAGGRFKARGATANPSGGVTDGQGNGVTGMSRHATSTSTNCCGPSSGRIRGRLRRPDDANH